MCNMGTAMCEANRCILIFVVFDPLNGKIPPNALPVKGLMMDFCTVPPYIGAGLNPCWSNGLFCLWNPNCMCPEWKTTPTLDDTIQ